jgi:tetratricopeptide (TPR) repeat protein
MDKIRKIMTPFLFFNFTLIGCLLNNIGQSQGALLATNMVSLDGKLSPKSDRTAISTNKEIEDTIREINHYSLSDSLWKMWRAIEDSQFVVAKVDSIRSMKTFIKGVNLAKEAFDLINELKQQNLDTLSVKKIKFTAILLFEKARAHFEETFKLNPFDIRTQNYLIWVFQNLAELYDHCDNKLRAINMLEYLTYILNDDPKLYYTLGQKYFSIGKWEQSLVNVRASIDLILDDDWNKIDTNQLFWHYYLRARAEMQLELIPEALLSLNYAKLIAPSEKEAGEVQKKIEWINWDDGNLNASRKSDTLETRLNQGAKDYSMIKQEYVELLSQVRTAKAKQDINWRIAQLEFNFLDEKEIAIDRMMKIVNATELDSTKSAADVKSQKYIEDYCLMSYVFGLDYLRNQHLKKAFVYFYQSISFSWSRIGKSYLQLAKLVALDNNAVLKFAEQALIYQDQLTDDERNSLYQLFYQSYKKLGRFDDAAIWLQKSVSFSMGE